MKLKLTRTLITGKITRNTPWCVMIEMCDAHGIKVDNDYIDNPKYIDKIIEVLNETDDLPEIEMPYGRDDFPYIARFVNHECKWPEEKLKEAFSFLLSVKGKDKKELLSECKFGKQTPDCTYRLNKCVLYYICKENNIETTFDMSYKALIYSCILLYNNKKANYFDFIPMNVIINLINSKKITVDFSNTKILTKVSSKLKDSEIPEDDFYAVMMAKRDYGINLSKCEYPLIEYINYSEKCQYDTDVSGLPDVQK